MSAGSGADVQAAFCATLCDEWARAGVTHAVVSPGSRSTPLVAALDAEARIQVHVVLDERSAGFTALGLGLATGRPAVVVTTSGTAAVELHPAVVEAGQARVPLLAVTADRPPELHRVGAPQTVEQRGLFGGACRFEVDPGVADGASAGGWRSLAARVVAEAAAGPVHLNLPFREPLIGDPAGFDPPPGRPGDRPWHARIPEPAVPSPEVVGLLRRHAGGRGLIVAGAGAGDPAAVLALAEMLRWPVLADPRSGARRPHPLVVSTADALLRTPVFAGLLPDAVLRLGEPWASKVLNQWLGALAPETPQVLAGAAGDWADPERRAELVSAATAPALVSALAGAGLKPALSPAQAGGAAPGAPGAALPERADWAQRWAAGERAARRALDDLLDGALAGSEPAVATATARAAADTGATLVVSSSMPVRDVEWFASPHPGLAVASNRGANGIDGVLSTAVGAAIADPARPTFALLGDLAFVYDAGALLWADRREVRLSVVVVDNGGGGIFSFLPQATALPPERFERYWGTPHHLDLVALAAAYGAGAERLDETAQLDRWLAGAGRRGVRVAVIGSDRAANVAAHDRLNAAVAAAVACL